LNFLARGYHQKAVRNPCPLWILEANLFEKKPIALLAAEALKQVPDTVTLGK